MPGVARGDPDRWALDMLGAVLGDGMSSRLFLELRERRSLTYDVSTFGATYSDCGTFGVHAGFDPDQAGALIAAIIDQLQRVVQDPVTVAELERARAYTRGRLELRMEESGAVAAWLGTGESLLPRILTVDEVIERLDAVTIDDLLRVARRYLRPELARLAVLGPFRSRLRFERMLAQKYPEHRKLLKTLGWVERISFSSYVSYLASVNHFSQVQKNQQMAREYGLQ